MLNLIEKIRKFLPINIIRQRIRKPFAAASLLNKIYEKESLGEKETQETHETQETQTQDVSFVLDCFKHMGASQDQLAAERNKLLADESYCKNWCKTTGFF